MHGVAVHWLRNRWELLDQIQKLFHLPNTKAWHKQPHADQFIDVVDQVSLSDEVEYIIITIRCPVRSRHISYWNAPFALH